MSAAEVGWRLQDYAKQWAWLPRQVKAGAPDQPWEQGRRALKPDPRGARAPHFGATLGQGVLLEVPPAARAGVIAGADELLAGHWELLGTTRHDMADPDWFFDPITGRSAPSSGYCFRIDHRSEDVTGNVKQVWELSRLQHVTILAAAFALSGDERYAERAARHLRSWWAKNPFLSGVHWTSGIEVGLRLISWVWVRRLLEGWDGAPDLFEQNDVALAQIWWHQRYLARFRSRGSSANNHVIAEAAGQLIASLAFDWFDQSEQWSRTAGALLEKELANNTFPTGVNRELASEYHGFVAELALLAAAEADRAHRPLSTQVWQILCRMLDVVAATVDVGLNPPRQGDGDDGKGLVLGPISLKRWESLLAIGARLFGAPTWWPRPAPDVMSTLVSSLADQHPGLDRPVRRPSHFADAGLVIMRTDPRDGPEIWCRCDSGPHGFLSIAAHAHADALAVEVRYDGTEVLADPGTYCYHGEPSWRSYFRSTLGHNTIEIAHQDQSTSGGPTLWVRHAESRLVELHLNEDGRVDLWSAEHSGYGTLEAPASHRRTVELLEQQRSIRIVDLVETTGRHSVRAAFHLGPDVHAAKTGERSVDLSWAGAGGDRNAATFELADGLSWSLVRGQPSRSWAGIPPASA